MANKPFAIELASELNAYDGDNAWQDVIYNYDFDRTATEEHDNDSTLVVFADDDDEMTPAVVYVEMDKTWIATTLEAVLTSRDGAGVGVMYNARLA